MKIRIPLASFVMAAFTFAGVAWAAGPAPVEVDQSLAPYASTKDSVRLPDGRELHFVCMGQGSPTVILTAGMGAAAFEAWSHIQPDMAKTTRVCSWDRPGWGLSDGTAAPSTVTTTTADLEAALATGKIPGPYVMVGHSIGSYESLLYTDRHPDKVVGMVLIDPSVPGQYALLQQTEPNLLAQADPAKSPVVQVIRKCAADIRAGIAKVGGPDPDHCFDYPPSWPAVLRQALGAKDSNPVQYATIASFATSMAEDSPAVVNPSRNYRDMPLIVLSATAQATPPNLTDTQKAEFDKFNEVFEQKHDELAALSTRGVNARVPGANHMIQLVKPQAVLDAVAQVVSEARESGQ